MARTKISEFSSTAADNTDIDGIDIAEGCAPSGINNAIRTLMADLKDMQTGASGDTFTFASLNATTANIDGGTIDGATIGGSSAAAGTFTSLSDSGNLTFTGTGNRITGDFSNATLASRVMFQTSTANSSSFVGHLPNGTGQASGAFFYAGSDPANTSALQIRAGLDNSQIYIASAATGTGTYLPLTFYTGATERVRIDTSGNVGIGVTPSAWSGMRAMDFGDGSLAISSDGSAFGDGSLTWNGYYNGSNWIYKYTGGAASRFRLNESGAAWFIAPSGTAGNAISFTQAMTLDASGNLLVGTTSNNGISLYGKIHANRENYGGYAGTFGISNTTSGVGVLGFFNANGIVGSVDVTGSSTAFVTSSDYRLKENIQPMQNALATVAQLKPCTYTWKADGSNGQGFIAHELQAVVPDCVTGEKDAVDADGKPVYQGVDTSFLVATLTAAIQEQQSIINSMQDRITLLEQAK